MAGIVPRKETWVPQREIWRGPFAVGCVSAALVLVKGRTTVLEAVGIGFLVALTATLVLQLVRLLVTRARRSRLSHLVLEEHGVHDLLGELIQLENEVDYRSPAPNESREFAYVPGTIPVLLSAPHGAAHTREVEKEEDEYTSAIARLVAKRTGAHVLYAHHKSDDDPNWDESCAYKDHLRTVVAEANITHLLDIHGARADRPFGIAVGTMSGRANPLLPRDALTAVFAEHGFTEGGTGLGRLDIDRAFTAELQHTVTKFASDQLGIGAAQFEINAHLRIVERREGATLSAPFRGGPEGIRRMVAAFIDLVRAIESTVF